MERKVGEIVNVNGTILQVYEAKESDGCNGCFFEELHPLCLPYICAAQEREDGKNVQFKQISKTMTTEEAKRRAELYSALAEGKTIQVQNPNGTWEDIKIEGLDHLYDCNNYRIKPEPMYRPFVSQEECWQEMHKHPDFGWIIAKDSKVIYHINIVGNGYIHIDGSSIIFSIAFGEYEFTDGTPFGIKEE